MAEQKSTVAPGNTRAVSTVRARAFQLTLNEPDKYEDLKKYLTHYSTLKYMVAAVETAPTTGHKHVHIYCQFSQAKSLMIDKCYGAHIEICKGTPQQNRNYIMKDGNILDELGEFNQQGGYGGKSIRDVMKMNDDELLDLDYRFYSVISKIRKDGIRLHVEGKKKKVRVIYLFGPSGCGKSRAAHKLLEKLAVPGALYDEVKYTENGFWIGMHNDCKYCIYDDFRDTDLKPNEFIKFIDYNYHTFNIKGGETINNYELIIITSIKSPWELYRNKNEEEKKQWLRRMEIFTIRDNKWEAIKEVPDDILI